MEVGLYNTATQVVLSGAGEAVDEAVSVIDGRGLADGFLPLLAIPAHSSLLAPMAEPFAEFLRAIPFKRPRVPIVSNCRGEPIFTPEAARAEAIMLPWSPVRWDKVMRHLVGRQVWTFAEIGHGSVLTNMLRQEHGQLGLALLTMENII